MHYEFLSLTIVETFVISKFCDQQSSESCCTRDDEVEEDMVDSGL